MLNTRAETSTFLIGVLVGRTGTDLQADNKNIIPKKKNL
jgi:hypothetical protein